MMTSLYSQLPETAETQFAREMTEMQSEVQSVIVPPFLYLFSFLHCSDFFEKNLLQKRREDEAHRTT